MRSTVKRIMTKVSQTAVRPCPEATETCQNRLTIFMLPWKLPCLRLCRSLVTTQTFLVRVEQNATSSQPMLAPCSLIPRFGVVFLVSLILDVFSLIFDVSLMSLKISHAKHCLLKGELAAQYGSSKVGRRSGSSVRSERSSKGTAKNR
jgi:hypothetical protein